MPSIPFDLSAQRPFIAAGPCSAETEEQLLSTCRALAATGRVDVLRAGIWKPRTHPGHFEGVGERGLPWLARARAETGLPVAVEVAGARHVDAALKAGIEVLWLGARTTVSPFAVQEVADALRGCTDVTVLVKNPLTPDPGLWAGAADRLLAAGLGSRRIGLILRGFPWYGHSRYRNPPMWHLALEMRNRFPGMAMLCDPSHICGCRELLREVAQTAADLCFDGLIIESHCDPDRAWSDAAQQLTPEALGELLASVRWRAGSADDPGYRTTLEQCRSEIDQLDGQLFELLGRRMEIADRIGRIKRENDVAILQDDRWKQVVRRITAEAQRLHLGEEFVRRILEAIHMESIDRQRRIIDESR